MFKTLLITAASVLALAACGPETVPQDIVDTNMTTSRLNSQKNADSYRLTQFPDSSRGLMQSDSTISKTCRYGDGWASGIIEFNDGPKQGQRVKIKCQTNGTGKGINGCMTDQEFQTKNYKDEDGKCGSLESLEKFK